ncbi:MAG: universal stress protein [Bacteroidia bacterium]|nr:universal stress protein [Bacteroidia bacterium]
MINSILVPTDFSPIANNALLYAIEFAKRCNANIHILHVKQVPLSDPNIPAEAYQMYIDEINKNEQDGIEKLKAAILIDANIKYTFHSAVGFVSDEVHSFTENNEVDLIIMGTKGASNLTEILIGTNAASVIGKTLIPALIIPPNFQFKPIKNILYATDYNEPEFPAFTRLVYIAEIFDASITVMHNKTDYDKYFNIESTFFNRNKEKLNYPNLKIVSQEQKDTLTAIDNWIDANKNDLVVLAKHNRSFFDRLFHRSLSKRMAYHTKIPLLILNK